MTSYVWLMSVACACILSVNGCDSSEEASKDNAKEKVKEAVRDAVTKDFKVYDSAKKSLAESEQKGKAQLDLLDKELN